MEEAGEWGTEFEINAICITFEVNIIVHEINKETKEYVTIEHIHNRPVENYYRYSITARMSSSRINKNSSSSTWNDSPA